MSLMIHCGLRLAEVIDLRLGSINLTKGKLRLLSGKGSKDRDFAIPDYLIDLLGSWRKKRLVDIFFSTLEGKKLSDRYIRHMVGRYALKADINKKNITVADYLNFIFYRF